MAASKPRDAREGMQHARRDLARIAPPTRCVGERCCSIRTTTIASSWLGTFARRLTVTNSSRRRMLELRYVGLLDVLEARGKFKESPLDGAAGVKGLSG